MTKLAMSEMLKREMCFLCIGDVHLSISPLKMSIVTL